MTWCLFYFVVFVVVAVTTRTTNIDAENEMTQPLFFVLFSVFFTHGARGVIKHVNTLFIFYDSFFKQIMKEISSGQRTESEMK